MNCLEKVSISFDELEGSDFSFCCKFKILSWVSHFKGNRTLTSDQDRAARSFNLLLAGFFRG